MEVGQVLEGRYKVLKKISESYLSTVYKISDRLSHKKLALKLYPKSSPEYMTEQEVYSTFSKIPGIPKYIGSGSFSSYNFLILELLGKSLQKLYSKSKFSLGCALEVSLQVLERLQSIHLLSYVYRNLCPENVLASEKKPLVYLADLSVCKKYRDPFSKVHCKYSENGGNVRNLKFCSVNANRGIEQTRRDDLESWLYLTLYFIKGTLPWELAAKNGVVDVALSKKAEFAIETWCEDVPVQFVEILRYVKQMKFNDQPNYQYLIDVLKSIGGAGVKLGLDWDRRFRANMSLQVKKDKRERRSNSGILSAETLNLIEEKQGKSEKVMNKSYEWPDEYLERSRKETTICDLPEFKFRKVSFRIEIAEAK